MTTLTLTQFNKPELFHNLILARLSVADSIVALLNTAPRECDYDPHHGRSFFALATLEHITRVDALKKVHAELTELGTHCAGGVK